VTHTDPGDHVVDTRSIDASRSSRRSLLGAGIGLSVLGAALTSVTGNSVGALSASAPTEDRVLMRVAMELELTARDLYDEAIAAGADPTIPGAMREQHESYAQSLAGATGFSANTRNDEVFEQLRGNFSTPDTVQMATIAFELESIAVATHTELLGLLQEANSARLIASIASMESRHCAVLAHASGRGDDLDALIVNTAEPLVLEDLS
jgi:rubrerythrin